MSCKPANPDKSSTRAHGRQGRAVQAIRAAVPPTELLGVAGASDLYLAADGGSWVSRNSLESVQISFNQPVTMGTYSLCFIGCFPSLL